MATTEEYGLGPQTFPRGWFMIASSETVTTKPQPARFFGREFALYRGNSGRVILLDAYCPHMGTHLARNTTSWVVRDGQQVEGDSIRCPYHGWRFGPDGRADDIPYHKGNAPKAACVRSWKVEERAGCVFVWHDPENGDPDYDLPEFAQWNDPSWVRWKIDELGTLPCHPQEIIDNICDMQHLAPIHGSVVEYFENEFDGHVAMQRQGGGHRTLTHDGRGFHTDTWYTGPGLLQNRMTGDYETLMMICHTPVEDGVTRAWHALMVKSPNTPPTEADHAMARAYQAQALDSFAQDFEVWNYKAPALSVMKLAADGPFDKARTWYRQFYNPRADAAKFQDRVRGIHHIPGVPGCQRPEAAE